MMINNLADVAKKTVRQNTNFDFKILGVYEYSDFYGHNLGTEVRIKLYNRNISEIVNIPVEDLAGYNFESVNPAFLIYPGKVNREKFIFKIKEKIAQSPRKNITKLTQLGFHANGKDVCFCAGNRIISAANHNYAVEKYLSENYRLDINRNLSEFDATQYVLNLMEVKPKYSSVLVMSGILGITRSLITEAGIKCPCVIYVLGKSQNRKTTLANLCTRMYNRSELNTDTGICTARVSSTNIILEQKMDALRDGTFILDDLYREKDTRMRHEYERRVRNCIRNFADNSSRQTRLSNFKNNCQLIITGEYLLDSKTDIGRCLVIHINKKISSKKLTPMQEDPLALSTFYFYFIRWICKNYFQILNDLKCSFMEYRETAFRHKSQYERLYEESFLLEFVMGLFGKYVTQLGILSKSEVDNRKHKFKKYIKHHIAYQLDLMKQLEAKEYGKINLSRALLLLLDSKAIKIAEKKSDCFLKGNKIYLRCQTFSRALYSEFGIEITANKISRYFSERGITEIYANRNVKKYNNKCYLVINCEELDKDAKDNSFCLKNVFY